MLTPVEFRHRMHSNPEIMFKEFETTKLIYDNLKDIPELKLHAPIDTGLIAEYTVNDGDYLIFRADIDALPIKEENEIEWKSKNDNMHACGHDVHTSILYSLIKKVIEEKPNQNIIFVFQPGEEGGNGAKSIIDSGILNKFNIRNAFALHVTDDYELGTIASTPGILFAAAVEVDIHFYGKSAHAAFPEQGRDSIKAMTRMLSYADKIVSEYKAPHLFAYGKIFGGTARNIIPAYAKAECTLRTLKVEELNGIIDKLKEEGNRIHKDMDVRVEIGLSSPYTEVEVDKELYEKCKVALSGKFKFLDCGYKMTAEDFGLYSKLYPSFMCWMGTRNGEKQGLHTSKFLPPDEAINLGTELLYTILKRI